MANLLSTTVNGQLNTGNVIDLGYTVNGSIATTAFRGINFHSSADFHYYIGKPAGSWTQPLHIHFYTGIWLRSHGSYGGTRFYNIATGSQLMSVGDGGDIVNIYSGLTVNGSLTNTGASYLGIIYDYDDNGYYLNPNSESKLRKIWINNGGAAGVSWSSGLNMGDGSNYWNLIQDAGTARQRNFGTGGYDWYNNTGGTQLMLLSNAGNLSVAGTITSQGNSVITSGNIGSQSVSYATSAGDASTLGGYGRGNTTNKIAYWDSTRNLYVNNPESYSGEVRLGAAWNRGGVYASGNLSLSTSGSQIDFVFSDATKAIIASDGNIYMSWAGSWLSTLLDAKQNASTAITTSNIGSQSVSYASSAGNADTLDGYHASSLTYVPIWTNNTQSAERSGFVSGGRWYRVANLGTERFFARVRIYDNSSGGPHASVEFQVSGAFNNSGSYSFTLTSNGYYSAPSVTQVRILSAGTYDPQFLEVYISYVGYAGSTFAVSLLEARNATVVNWEDGSIPSGYAATTWDANGPLATGGRAAIFNSGIYNTNDYSRFGNVLIGEGTYKNTIKPIGDVNLNISTASGAVYFDTYGQASGSFRAPIFYDSADTGYYLDPNGTSNLLKLSERTMGFNGMNPMSASSPYESRFNASAGYRNGTMGYGNTDFNTIARNWGSGFIDTWSSPANAPGGSTHYIGLQGVHYSDGGTSFYGFQMACAGEADNRFFWRSSWPSMRSWVEMIHSGNIGSQSVSYATSAGNSSTTSQIVFNDLKTNFPSGAGGGHSFASNHYSMGLDSGNGGWDSPHYRDLIIGYHTGVRIGAHYSGIRFYDNSPTTDANNDGNGDGGEKLLMTIGGYVGTANQTDVVVNNNLFANVSMRAPIFYDSNDTTYYGDFASTSYLRHLSVGDVNASNDGGWNARLNLTGSSHARLDVKSNSDGIITTMYSHAGQGVGRVGTMSNHPLAFMVNGNVAGYAYANYLQGVDSVRAPIFYDSNDTNYYLDPNGISVLAGFNLNTAGTAKFRYLAPGEGTVNINAPFAFNSATGAINIAMTDNDTGGVVIDNEGVTVYGAGDTGAVFRVIDEDVWQTNGNNVEGATTFRVLQGAGAGTQTKGQIYSDSSVSAPIFYDANDTTYYLDPNADLSLRVYGEICNSNYVEGKMQPGALNIGRTDTNYAWDGGSWAGDVRLGILANTSETWEFGIHDSGDSVMSVVHFDGGSTLTMGRNLGWGQCVVNAPAGYVSNSNPWGTANSAYFPNGITTAGGTNWIYGFTYIGNAPGNGNGHEFNANGTQYSTASITTPTFIVNNHSDNTRGYRIHNTSGTAVSAMFVNSSNQLVIAAGAVDQINLNKKVYVNGVALGVNVAPSATAGRIDASNDIVAYSTSDERFKENITPIPNALDKVKTLTGVEFDWRKETKDYHGYVGHDVGVIAQQVKAVLPEAVRTNANGYLAVRYEKLIGLLIEGMKEQQAQIDELKAKLDGLTK